jgi:hypothetical protein
VADSFQQEIIGFCDKSENELTFIFSLSQDEESTDLRLQSKTLCIDFEIRSHHYLTALLARYRNQDNQNRIDEHLQGWVSIEKLTTDLGLTESHVNIQIHRARKQLADKLQGYGTGRCWLSVKKVR